MNVLHKRYVEGDSALGNLVIQCYQFFNHEEVERISDYYEYPTIVDIICSKSGGRKDMGKRSGDRVCVWSYLKRMVMSDNEYFKDIFTETLRLFMSIKGQILLSPKLAEISLLTLIFMLRQLVSYVCRAPLCYILYNQRHVTCCHKLHEPFLRADFFSFLWECF